MFNGPIYAVLLNVLYFHGSWTVPLYESPDTFYNLSGTLTKVNFVGMEGEGYYPYVKTNNYLALGVGYNNSKLEMDFIMPTSENLTKFISSLTTQQLNLITSNLNKVRNEMSTNELIGSGSIEFPEFDVKSSIGLYNVLEQLGVNLDNSDVTAVYQQDRIKVDRYGTTAAAATEVPIGSSLEPPVNPVVINHPFMFLIRDRATNTIYFLGQVTSLRC
jgi:serine protease inhibitor